MHRPHVTGQIHHTNQLLPKYTRLLVFAKTLAIIKLYSCPILALNNSFFTLAFQQLLTA